VQNLRTALRPGTLYAWGRSLVAALDPVDGRILWEAPVEPDAEFVVHFLTEDYVVALDLREPAIESLDRLCTAIFYERSDGTPAIAGGAAELGAFGFLRGITIRDHCLLLVDGQTIHAWVNPPGEP
jgi:hypothetical protein